MSDLYRKVEGPTGDLEGDWFGMEFEIGGKVVEVAFVPVTIDYEAAADAFNGEMIRITGASSAVEMRAIHAAVDAALGVAEGDDDE